MRFSAKKTVLMGVCALALCAPCAAFAAGGATTSDDAQKDVAAAEQAEGAKANEKADAAATEDAGAADADEEAAEKPGPSEELLAWADGKDCGVCHEVPAASLDDKELAAHLHAAFSLACIDCHADDALIEVHENAKADAKVPTKLKKSKISVETCATCHPHDALVEKTAESNALVDSEGTVVNPHDVPDVKEHQKLTCASCHNMHVESKPASKAPSLCQDCHHEDVYECYTCHS